MDNQRFAILILALAGMAATFMPWMEAPMIGSIRGTKDDGWLTFFLFLIPLILSMVGDKSRPLRSWFLYAAVLPGLVATAIGISNFFQEQSPTFSPGYGLYLMILAGIVLAIAAFLFQGNGPGTQDRKGSFSYKSRIKKTGPPD